MAVEHRLTLDYNETALGRAIDYGDLVSFVVQSSYAQIGSMLSLWRRGLETSAKYSLEIVQTVGTKSPAAEQPATVQATLIDLARSYFREMAELRCSEGRQFQRQLEEIVAGSGPELTGRMSLTDGTGASKRERGLCSSSSNIEFES